MCVCVCDCFVCVHGCLHGMHTYMYIYVLLTHNPMTQCLLSIFYNYTLQSLNTNLSFVLWTQAAGMGIKLGASSLPPRLTVHIKQHSCPMTSHSLSHSTNITLSHCRFANKMDQMMPVQPGSSTDYPVAWVN